MGQTFDIKKVIEHYKLDTNEVAEALFPHVRYKTLALNRVLKGEAYLDADDYNSDGLIKMNDVIRMLKENNK